MSSVTDIAVPEEVRAAFPEIVELILGSESMRDEERKYWIGALPTMKPEHLSSLRDILQNEREQLKLIDAKYGKQLTEIEKKQSAEAMGKERKEKRMQRLSKEEEHREEEKQAKEELLRKMEDVDPA